MNRVRFAAREKGPPWLPCCRCAHTHERWDRIAGQPCCPSCEENLVLGEAEPLILKTQPRACAVCQRQGTVCYLTFPLQSSRPLEMDLCGEHLRALLARNLTPAAFQCLRQQLQALGLAADQVFLLHDAFYDAQGHALQPALEW
jgi:hypothetical protein